MRFRPRVWSNRPEGGWPTTATAQFTRRTHSGPQRAQDHAIGHRTMLGLASNLVVVFSSYGHGRSRMMPTLPSPMTVKLGAEKASM